MKKYIFSSLIFIFIIALIIAGIWLLVKPDQLSPEELAFLKQEGFLDENGKPLRSPGLTQQDLNAPDESFQVLATKLNKNTGSYQLAFRLENKSNQNKEFYLIPVSEKDQLEFKEIKGVINNRNILSINKDDVRKDPLESLYNIKQHKEELNPELAQAYDDMEGNNYQGDPIKITLGPNSTLIAKSGWEIKDKSRGPSSTLRPVYFLVYGSAGGAKEELTILTVHSHPRQGDDWPVEFTTVGTADLKIIPDDQATIDDDEFKALYCNDEERFPQILTGDIIYYPDWQCEGIGKVVHYTLVAGNHKLRFEFGDRIEYAYNAPPLEFHSGFETGDFSEWPSTIGSPTIDSTTKKTGTYAMRANTSAASAYLDNNDDYRRASFYLYITSAPGSGTTAVILGQNDNATYAVNVRLTEDRYLTIYDQDTLMDTGSTQLNTGQWYRVSLSVNYGFNAKVFLNGNEECSTTSMLGGDRFYAYFGIYNAVTADLYFDNFAADTNVDMTDLGDIRVQVALPESNGAQNDYDQTSGYTYVDNLVSVGDGDYVENNGNPAGISRELFNLPSMSDMGISGATPEAVNVITRQDRDGGGGTTHYISAYSNSTNYDTATAGDNAWTQYNKYYAAKPETGVWDETAWDAFQAGCGHDGAQDQRCSAVNVMLAYTPDAGSASTISEVTDGPDAIEVGQTITFTVTWTDPDAPDGQHMYICKDDDGTSSGCGGGGTWCKDDDSYDTSSPLSCTYVIASGDVGVQDYYAFTCDAMNNCSSTTGLTQGTFTAKIDDSFSCATPTLTDLFNGTGQGFTGGSQANGGVDDYNDGGSAPVDRYEGSWTACTSGNNYCGTGLSSADAKDNQTNLVWSLPCNGSGCASFSDSSPLTYTWDNSGANNNSQIASELCSAGSHGESGWSLPHQKQLMQTYIDGSYGNLEATGVARYYWSATTYSATTTSAWRATLSRGHTNYNAKTNDGYVRCLRSAN